MAKINYITDYNITLYNYKKLHSAGPDLYFMWPCIGYIKQGHAKFLLNGKTFYAEKGDLIYIAFETKYQSLWSGEPEISWYSVNFDFDSKYAFYDYRFQIIKNFPQELFDKMYKTYDEAPMKSISYLYELLDDVYSRLTPNPQNHKTVEKALEYIEKNYSSHIEIKTLSRLCNCCESLFYRLFRDATGVTPITYKHNIMIQNAIDLLANTQIPIEEISHRVGFSSSNFFRKIFYEMTGKTPKTIRKHS